MAVPLYDTPKAGYFASRYWKKPLRLAFARQPFPFWHECATSPGRGSLSYGGEPLAKRFCFENVRRFHRKRCGLPKPPLSGEVASSEAMMTERFNRQRRLRGCTTARPDPEAITAKRLCGAVSRSISDTTTSGGDPYLKRIEKDPPRRCTHGRAAHGGT